MAESQAKLGYGTTFGISDDNGSTYPTLADVTGITPPGKSVDMVDVTHMESPDRTREYIEGLIDPGECSLELNFVPSSTTDNTLQGLSGDQKCRITFPGGTTWDFTALLTDYAPEAPVDDKMTASVTFKVKSSVVRTAP